MRRRPVVFPLAVPLLAAVCLAGCGGGSHQAAETTATAAEPSPSGVLGPGGRTLYQSGDWGVVVRGATAAAARLVAGRWRVDRSGGVKVTVLGTGGPVARTPQVAAELQARAPLVDTGLWLDGTALLAKGGGLSPKRQTIYGAPTKPLRPGRHVAVAYGRTATTGTAVAWTLVVR